LPIRSPKELKKLDSVLQLPVKNSLSSASNPNLLRGVFPQKRHVPPPKSCPEGYIFNVISKPTRLFGYSAGRPIAVARKAASTTRFHFSTVPIGHLLLWFESVKSHEMVSPIPGGELGYKDDDDNENIANLAPGTLFHWPSKLLRTPDDSEDVLPEDYEADLLAPVQLGEEQREDEQSLTTTGDALLSRAYKKTEKSRNRMVEKYSKRHEIEVFAVGDIVTLKLPRGTRTSTDNRRVFGRVLGMPHRDRYEVQTEFGVVDRLIPARELAPVSALLARGIDVQGPRKKLALSAIAKKNSTSERVIISCKCKGKCATKRCNCFKNGKRCSVHCHSNAEHDCGFLASLALRTEVAMKEKGKESDDEISERRRGKRARANTAGDVA
jgi:hypothetical protein